MIAAMNLRMAVLTRTPWQALTRRAAGKLARCGRLVATEKSTRVANRQVVALLAKIGTRGDQEFVVIRAVHRMTVDATLTHRCVFPQKRATLFGMTAITNNIRTLRF